MNRASRRAVERYKRKHGAAAALHALGMGKQADKHRAARADLILTMLREHGVIAALDVFTEDEVHRIIQEHPELSRQVQKEMQEYIQKNKGDAPA